MNPQIGLTERRPAARARRRVSIKSESKLREHSLPGQAIRVGPRKGLAQVVAAGRRQTDSDSRAPARARRPYSESRPEP